jgi:hypothetical protein
MNREEAKELIKKTCGDGWIHLVDRVFDNLPRNSSVSQAYQKYAALKFDVEPYCEEFENYLEQIEEESLNTCEKCGSKGHRYIVNNWEHTRCEEHSEDGIYIE